MKILILPIALLLCGCEPDWILRNEPTTDAERKAVVEHVERIIGATPKTLSGHDQDWDDAIAEAHRQARKSLCRPTMWEYSQHYTGRWKYTTEVKN